MRDASASEQAADFSLAGYSEAEPLGAGGNGRLWVARRDSDQRLYALKEVVLAPRERPKELELFQRECRALRALTHDQIPRFIELHSQKLSPDREIAWLVQEYIDGPSLQSLLDKGVRLSTEDTVAVLRGALAPLAYLHSRRPPVFHRDIKPANLLVRRDGTLVLVDFGAVRNANFADGLMGSSIVGTFGFMAPEQLQGRVTRSSDLYALGATGVYLLTGMEPLRFELERLRPNIRPHLDCDDRLISIFERLLEPVPEDRFADAMSVDQALMDWQLMHDRPRSSLSARALVELELAPQELASLEPAPAPEPAQAQAHRPAVESTPEPAQGVVLDPALWQADPAPPAELTPAPTPAPTPGASPSPTPPPAGSSAPPPSSSAQLPAPPIRRAAAQPQAPPESAHAQLPAVMQVYGGLWSSIRPGGPASAELAILLITPGLGGVLIGLTELLPYDSELALKIGAVMILVGLFWLLWPRPKLINERRRALRHPLKADARLVHITRERLPFAPSRWWATLEYEDDDELEHSVSCQLSGAREAKLLARGAVAPQLRVSPNNPLQAQVFLKAKGLERGDDER